MKKEKIIKTKIDGIVVETATRTCGDAIIVTNSILSKGKSTTSITYFNKCVVCGEYILSQVASSKFLCKECEAMLRDRFSLADTLSKAKEQKPKRVVDIVAKKRVIDPNYICGETKKTSFIRYIKDHPTTIKIKDYETRNVKYLSREMAEKLFELIALGIDTKAELARETGLKETSITRYTEFLSVAKLIYWNRKEKRYFTYNNVPIERVVR